MITKYKTSYGDDSISKVDVVRETEQSVWVKPVTRFGVELAERREAKMSNSICYFDTWQQAQELLLNRAQNEVDKYRRYLEQAKGHLGNIKGMKEPQL